MPIPPSRSTHRRKATIALLILSCSLSLAALAVGGESPVSSDALPAVLKSGDAENPYPAWVAAREAVDREGRLRHGLLAPGMASSLEHEVDEYRRLAGPEIAHRSNTEALRGGNVELIPVEDCQSILAAPTGTWGSPDATLTDPLRRLIRHSKAIVTGTVAGTQPGFVELPILTFRPALLNRVVPDKVLFSADRVPQELLLLTYGAHFKIGDVAFCGQTFEGYDYQPRSGDRVLFFDWYGPHDPSGRLFAPHPRQMVYETREGKLVLPPVLEHEEALRSATSLDDVVEVVRSLGSKPEVGPK